MAIEEIPITHEEFSDSNSPAVIKINGIALTPVEAILAAKINALIREANAKQA